MVFVKFEFLRHVICILRGLRGLHGLRCLWRNMFNTSTASTASNTSTASNPSTASKKSNGTSHWSEYDGTCSLVGCMRWRLESNRFRGAFLDDNLRSRNHFVFGGLTGGDWCG